MQGNSRFWVVLFMLSSIAVNAQHRYKVRIVDLQSEPVEYARMKIVNNDHDTTYLNWRGFFSIKLSDTAKVKLIISREGDKDEFITIRPEQIAQSNDTTIFQHVLLFGNENIRYDDEPVVLHTAYYQAGYKNAVAYGILKKDDPYDAVAAAHWLQSGFRKRNYSSEYQTVCINGMEVNDLSTGAVNTSSWSGLYSILQPADYTNMFFPFGSEIYNIGGAVDYNVKAENYDKGGLLHYGISNISAVNHLTAFGATGTNTGFSAAAAFSAQFGKEGYVQGTSNYTYSYFLSLQQTKRRHMFSLVGLGSWAQRGLVTGSADIFNKALRTHYYNQAWGYQSNKKRNANMYTCHEPIIVFKHEWVIDDNSMWKTSFGTRFGVNKLSVLDWQNAANPYPTAHNIEGGDYEEILSRWYVNYNISRLNWDNMYQINYLMADNGMPSVYALGNETSKHYQLSLSSEFQTVVHNCCRSGRLISITAGMQMQYQNVRNYKSMLDLLGGSYWLSEPVANKFDSISEGDVYDYDYNIRTWNEKAWFSAKFYCHRFKFFVRTNLGAQHIRRKGNMPGISPAIGKDKHRTNGKDYIYGGIYFGGNVEMSKRNNICFRLLWQVMPVSAENTYLTPRYSSLTLAGVKPMNNLAGEVSYNLKHRRIHARVTGYMHYEWNHSMVSSFHSDTGSALVQQGRIVNVLNAGVEAGVDVKLMNYLTCFGAANWHISKYTKIQIHEPCVVDDIMYDMFTGTFTHYYPEPHSLWYATLGLKFAHPTMWYAELACNYFSGQTYVYIPMENPIVIWSEDPYYVHGRSGGFTVDVQLGKIFAIRKAKLDINLKVNNLLNNKHIVNAMYGVKTQNYMLSQYRYSYMYGLTFTFGATLHL